MALLETLKGSIITRSIVGALALIPAGALVFWDELLLAGPIIFLVEVFGFWLGYIIFCLLWLLMGFATLGFWPKIKPLVISFASWLFNREFGKNSTEETEKEELPDNWRTKFIFWVAKLARGLGALAAVVLMGAFSWAPLKALGYTKRDVYLFTFAAAWIFGAIWVPFYSKGVWDLGINSLLS